MWSFQYIPTPIYLFFALLGWALLPSRFLPAYQNLESDLPWMTTMFISTSGWIWFLLPLPVVLYVVRSRYRAVKNRKATLIVDVTCVVSAVSILITLICALVMPMYSNLQV